MEIQGRLVEALKNKKLILFTGAGVGQAAGLYSTTELRDYIYEEALALNYSGLKDQSLERLAASLQNNPSFNRTWLNRVVSDYFCKPSNYITLDDHMKVLQLDCLDSIFTTNYDVAFEQAATRACLDLNVKVVDSITPSNTSNHTNSINCFKLHGCAQKVSNDPANARLLVLSKRDWNLANSDRKAMLRELTTKVNGGCVVVFVGFNLSNGDNSDVERAIFEGNADVLRTDHWQSNSCFALKRSPTEEEINNYREDYACEVLAGDFASFVAALEEVKNRVKPSNVFNSGEVKDVTFLSLNNTARFTSRYLDSLSNSFIIWHDKTISVLAEESCSIDCWHEPPSIKMLSNNRYIERDILSNVIRNVTTIIKGIAKNKRNEVVTILGERGVGKSVILLQLAKYYYQDLKQPVVFLKESGFLEIQSSNKTHLLVQGWEGKTLDLVLQEFFNNENTVPLLILDNQPHRKVKAEQLIAYLSSHGKACLLVVADYPSADRNDNYEKSISIPNQLSKNEIERLFDVLSCDRIDIINKREDLLSRGFNQCNRDVLIIMYEWLDKEFRPFQQIIADSANLISKSNLLREVYILIASFHNAGFIPSLSLIIRTADYPADDVLKKMKDGDFGLHLSSDAMFLYRHTLISSHLLDEMGVSAIDQCRAIIKCIEKASASDVLFFKDFLDFLFSLGNPQFSIKEIEKIKEATEKNSVFDNEWDLHHKYAAYLIRDSQDMKYYEQARYYCDKALSLAMDDVNFSSIYHTLGNLEFKQYQLTYDKDSSKSAQCFERAVENFQRSKQLRTFQTEHAYVTHIDFINFQLDHISSIAKTIENEVDSGTALEADKFATYWEALQVVDKDRQKYLTDRVKNERSLLWENLPESVCQYIKANAYLDMPNKILFDCYIEQCLKQQSIKSRDEIFDIYQKHKESQDPDLLIPLMESMKRAFLLDAASRSSIVRTIASTLFDPKSSIANTTRARGIRLLAIDSFVSGQFDYLSKHVLKNASILYQEIRPSFLDVEYILPQELYNLCGIDSNDALNMYLEYGPNCFFSVKTADIMEKSFYRRKDHQSKPKYTWLGTSSFGDFLLKVPTIEIPTNMSYFNANCIVYYSPYGMAGKLLGPSKS